jgi:diadenosine tetraphosphate (Ap4A) HIT family hydrolase
MKSYKVNGCPFCTLLRDDIVFDKNEEFFAKYDRYPVSAGHTLLIPNRHIQSFFQLTQSEIISLQKLAKSVKITLDNTFHPDGFNIGINDGSAAGQTINHLHVHIIPRYFGDVALPQGGVRNLMPTHLVQYSQEDILSF